MSDKGKGALTKDNAGMVRSCQLCDHGMGCLGVAVIEMVRGTDKLRGIEMRQALFDLIGIIAKELLRCRIGIDNGACGIGDHDFGFTPIDGGADTGEFLFFGLDFRQVGTGGDKTILVPTGSPL